MDWMAIVSAGLLAAVLVYFLPRARAMIKGSPKGSSSDWAGAAIPLVLVVLFVLLLVKIT